MPLDNALQGCTYRALCDLDHAYLSNSISWLSPQLTLMQIQNPFASLFFFFSSIHSNKWILFLTLVLNFLFCKSSHGWLLFTMQDSTQIASLPWGLPPSYPTFTLFTDPSLFFSPTEVTIIRNYPWNSLFVSLVPTYKSRVLACLVFASYWSGWYIASSQCTFLKERKDY